MTLEQLRIFVGVAEREHMTAAARALNVTQSAASAAIAALEERHAIKLFHRVGRGIALTEGGQLFLTEARGVLARAAAAENVLEEMSGLERGTLRVVASQTIASYWLPQHLAAFHSRHPRLAIEVAIGNTEQSAAAVRDGDADLGFVEGSTDEPALARWPVAEDPLVLVSAASPTELSLAAADLLALRWLLREPGSGTRSVLEERLNAIGVDPTTLDVALVLPSNEAIRTAAEAGAGVAVLSTLVVAPALAAGTLHALPLELAPRPFFALRHKERYRTRAADALLQVIQDS
jgi:DNA-binding transcriptional LysR family regulator